MLFRRLLVCSALASVLLTGCHAGRYRRDPGRPIYQPPGGYTIPPTAIPDTPLPPVAPVPRDPGPSTSNAELLLPQQAPPGKIRSDYPSPTAPARANTGAILGEPDVDFPAPSTDGNVEPAERPTEAAKPDATDTIPDFTQVKPGVSAGRRPGLDGLDWLKAQGYKTVIYLRGPDDDDATDRQQVEKRGMEFVGLIATPDTLSEVWVRQFNTRLDDTTARPIFVYSRDEAIAGAVWYLNLRTAEFLTHDEARVRAGRLGLKDETTDIYRSALKVVPPGK